MGLFDGLKFWKKKDKDLGLNQNLGMKEETALPTDWGTSPQQPAQPGFQQSPGFQPSQPGFQPAFQPQMESFQERRAYNESKDVELILAKLDSIKVMIDNINQRLANLERAAFGTQQYGHNFEEQRKRIW